MNKFPIEIDGKEYIFEVTRAGLKKIDIDPTNSNNMNSTIETIENMFCAYLDKNHSDLTIEEKLELLDKAILEYGFEEIAKAIGKITDEGFTMKPTGKKIPWLVEKEIVK